MEGVPAGAKSLPQKWNACKNKKAALSGGPAPCVSESLVRVEDVLERIDRVVVHAHFIVKVRTGGAAGGTDVADDVAAFHVLAGADGEAGEVAVARRVAVAVRDVDDVAVAVGPLRLDDDAVRGRAHRSADGRGDVDGVVLAGFTGEGIGTTAETVGEDAAHR